MGDDVSMTSSRTDDDVAGTVAGHVAVTWQEATQVGDSLDDCTGGVTWVVDCAGVTWAGDVTGR